MGAGSVGCWVGGRLAAAGARVHVIGRPRVVNVLRTQGLTLSDVEGPTLHVAPDALDASELPPDGAAPGLVLLAVKSAGTEAAAAQLARVLPAGTPLLSLQNGVDNAARAQAVAPQLRVVPGMVPFNVAELAPGHLHRGTQGVLAAQHDVALTPWLPLFARAGLPLALHADLAPVQWGKLLLNLNNPVNALSRLPLRAELMQRDWRRCFAALMDEALGVLRAAGMEPARVAPVPPRWLPTLLRLPDAMFTRVAARMLRIDEKARSSMADDVALGRRTEIDALCGEVVRLARAHGLAAPRNARMLQLLDGRWPEGPPVMTAGELWSALKRA